MGIKEIEEAAGAQPPPAAPRLASSAAAATNARQRSCSAVRQASSRCGSTRRSTGSSSAASSSEPRTPAPTAASAAAPATVASAPPASTGTPIASAWSSSISGSLVRPPSTRRASDVDGLADGGHDVGHAPGDALERRAGHVRPGGAAVDAGEHRVGLRAPPRRAEARQRRQHARARRRRRPRAPARRAPAGRRPGRARGTATRASRRPRTRRRRARTPCGRRCSRPPSAAGRPARLRDLVAHMGEHEHAGAVGGLHPAGHDAARAGQRGLLVDGLAGERELDRPARGGASPARRPCRAPRAAPRAARRRARTARGRSRACRARAAACARRWRHRWRSRRPGGRTGTSRRCPCAACPASRARCDRVVVLEQPGELRGREVGVEGQAAAALDLLLAVADAVENLLRALVLPHDDRAERRAGLRVPGEHRLALVVEAAGDDLPGRVVEQLGDRLHDRGQHLLAVLLDPARPAGGGSPCRAAPPRPAAGARRTARP